jgi:hypothetical protein
MRQVHLRTIPLHRPLNVVVDDVGVDLGGGDPGVSQNLRQVEKIADSLLIFLKSFSINRVHPITLP